MIRLVTLLLFVNLCDVRFSGAASVKESAAGKVRCGAVDDTAAIQSILNTRRFVRFAAGVCVVGPLFVRSDTVVEFAPATVLKARPGYAQGESLLSVVDAANVTIRGNGGAIVMNGAEYTSGEQRHAMIIQGSSGVTIERLTAYGSGGDGFYIGAGYKHAFSENIELRQCLADHNRRNGLSIVSGKNVTIDGGEFRETGGTLPESGIDVEPNGPSDRAEHIRILGVRTRNNRGGGLTIAPAGLGAAPGGAISLEIDGLTSENDGGNAVGGGIRLALPGPPFGLAHEIGGEIRLVNARVLEPKGWGVAVAHRWVRQAPRAVFQNVVVRNPNAEGTGRADFGWSGAENEMAANSGFVVSTLAADAHAGSQRIEFRQCRAEDRRAQPMMRQAFYVHSETPGAEADVVREDSPSR